MSWLRRRNINQTEAAGTLSGSDRILVAQGGSPEAKYGLLSALGSWLVDFLGSMSAQDAGNVAITGGTMSNVAVTSLPAPSAPGDAARKSYVDATVSALIGANDVEVFKGVIACAGNPNYPAADAGHVYRVSSAGKIGGASGVAVEVNDRVQCVADGTAAGDQATVGARWWITQANIDGAVTGPVSAVDGTPAVFDGASGKLLKNITFAAFKTLLALVKADVGLGNVDNTSDATKNAATATLSGKTLSAPVITGAADIQQSLQFSGDTTPAQITGTTNDYAPASFAAVSVIRISTDASRDITGLAGGSDGRMVYVINVGAFAAVLKEEGAGSTAANRFAFGGDMTLSSKQGAALLYDATAQRWRQVGGPSQSGAGSGTVTNVATTYPLAGGPLTTSGTLAYSGPSECGRLTFSSATALQYLPLKGDTLKINGAVVQIPAAGLAGGGNTGVFVNGTAASNLGASTKYFVYAFLNSGVPTIDFSTTAHAASSSAGNIGTEIKSGDDTRSLIGMVVTNASSQFVDIQCVSWFNRRRKVAAISGSVTVSPTALPFAAWNDSAVSFVLSGWMLNSATAFNAGAIYLDGAQVGETGTGDTAAGVIQRVNVSTSHEMPVSEGSHSAAPVIVTSTGTPQLIYKFSIVIQG